MLVPHPIKETSNKCVKFIFQLLISIFLLIHATQLIYNVPQLQASVDEVRLSERALTMAIGITAPIQAMLFISSTPTNIRGQTFAIGSARAECESNIYK